MKKSLSFPLTILFGVAVFFFILSFSIGLPIYCRFFYYLHINALDLPKITGYDYATIKEAYNQVLNYLTLPGFEFGAGVFKFSEEGAAHFADCKVLFNINLIALILSSAIIVATLILQKKNIVELKRPFGYSVAFTSAVSVLAIIVLLFGIVSINFEKAFVIFHKIFFAGKDNWTFDPRYDQIINVLPQEFFMNCAIFIGVGIIALSVGIIVFQIVAKKLKNKKIEKTSENSLTND